MPAKKTSSSAGGKYTRPALREKIKRKLKSSSKGGRPGQWSARKSQLLASEYRKAGGGYRGGKAQSQKDLEKWTDEQWQTAEGKTRARHGKTTSRYLPKKAWDKLSPAEKRATDRKKKAASRKGRQFVANTRRAKAARRSATK